MPINSLDSSRPLASGSALLPVGIGNVPAGRRGQASAGKNLDEFDKEAKLKCKEITSGMPPLLNASPNVKKKLTPKFLGPLLKEDRYKALVQSLESGLAEVRKSVEQFHAEGKDSKEYSRMNTRLNELEILRLLAQCIYVYKKCIPFAAKSENNPLQARFQAEFENIDNKLKKIEEGLRAEESEDEILKRLEDFGKTWKFVQPICEEAPPLFFEYLRAKNMTFGKVDLAGGTEEFAEKCLLPQANYQNVSRVSVRSKAGIIAVLKKQMECRKEGNSNAELENLFSLNMVLSKKLGRFTANWSAFFKNIESHKNKDVVVEMLRGYHRQANSLARQCAGFSVKLEEAGLDCKADFEKVAEYLNETHLGVDYELRKRGVDPQMPVIKPKKQSGHVLQLQMKKNQDAAGAGKSALLAASSSEPTEATQIVSGHEPEAEAEDEEISDLLQLAAFRGLSGPKAVSREEKSKALEDMVDKCRKNLDETAVSLGRAPAKPLGEHTKDEVEDHVRKENADIAIHKLRTEEAVAHLKELEKVTGESKEEEIRALQAAHVELAITTSKNTLMPNKGALEILLEYGQIQMPLVVTEDGRPYVREGSGDDPGERNLFDVIALRTKDGKVWAKAHPHYIGNPDTGEAALFENGRKQYLVVHLKHPDQDGLGRAHEAATGQTVHRWEIPVSNFIALADERNAVA